MTVISDMALIELIGIGQRADAFSLRVLNPDRSPLGETIDVVGVPAPSLQVDTSRLSSIRTLSNVTILNPPAELDPNFARIQPILTLSNGSPYPLGVFMFGMDERTIYTASEIWTPEMFDEGFLLEQGLDRPWSIDVGGSVLTLFTQIAGSILGPFGIPTDYNVPDVLAASPVSFSVGSTGNAALQPLAELLGCFPPFFDNSGVHSLKLAPAAGAAADHTYTDGTRVFDGTFKATNSKFKAFNRYIVTGDAVSSAAVVGIFDLPDSAPNSYAQTGKRVTAPLHTVTGLTDPALAQQIALVDALTDRTTYATATFSAAADPRHDVFDTVNARGDLYLETGWQMELSSGGAHQHSLSRIWQ